MLKSVVALSAGLIARANAFWRMECPGRIGLARIDPIVNPGGDSSHVHSIFGSSGFSHNSNTEHLEKGSCTSCRVIQDKSAYWHPALYFRDDTTGEFVNVPQIGGMLAYYLLYGENITAFPPGFRMISGNNDRRNYTLGDPNKPDPEKSFWAARGETSQEALAQRAVGFSCLDYSGKAEDTLYHHMLPDKSFLARCKNGVRFEVMFPSCWKGGNALDSPNHKDHVAFPSLVMDGTCPEGYPARLPSLLYEVIWDTSAFQDAKGTFVLSNGDTTGFGYHADFMTGWNQAFLQQAIDTCTSPSGKIQDCPLFNVTNEATAKKCKLPNDLVNKEKVDGPLDRLPGNNEVTYGGGKPSASPPEVPMLNPPYAPGQRPPVPASPPSGQVFKEKTNPAPKKTAPPVGNSDPSLKKPPPTVGNTGPPPKKQPAPPVGKTDSSPIVLPPPVELPDTSPKQVPPSPVEKPASPPSASTTRPALVAANAVDAAPSPEPITSPLPPQATSPPASNVEIYGTEYGTAAQPSGRLR